MAQVARHLGSGESLQFAALVKVLTALDGGAAFASVEGKQVSTWDGGWWAVSTMTTVGYGDLYPHTDEGRAIAIMVMLVGIGFVAVLTASIAQRFVGEQVATAEMEIERDEAEVLAELLDLQRSCATSRGRSNGSSDQPAKYERAALRRCRLDVASGKRQAPGHVAEAGSVP